MTRRETDLTTQISDPDVLQTESAPPDSAPARGESPALDLDGVRRRDPSALAALFERYFDRLFGIVLRMLGDRTAAEDAIQEVFLKIYRGAPSLDPGRDPGPWLVTIAINVCRDEWRSNARRLARASTSIEATPGLREALTTDRADPERDVLALERARLVQEAILRLSPGLREVVVLREYEDLGYDEIARITGVSEPALRKRFSRACEELGKRLRWADG